MKNCPHCNAEIHENARFCFYCMTSLEEKKAAGVIKNINKGWQGVTAALLVFCLAAVCLLTMGKKAPAPSVNSFFSQGESASLILDGSSPLQNDSSLFESSLQEGSSSNESAEEGDYSSLLSRPNHSIPVLSSSYQSSEKSPSTPVYAPVSSTGQASTSSYTQASTSTSSYPQASTSTSSRQQEQTSTSTSSKQQEQTSTSTSSHTQAPTSTSSNVSSSSNNNENIYSFTIKNNVATITKVKTALSGNVDIPGRLGGYPVSILGAGVFSNQSAITSVTVPDSFTIIGDSSFSECSALKKIVFGKNVELIGFTALQNCTELTDVVLPKSIKNIDSAAFDKCSSLKNVWYEGTPEDKSKIVIGSFFSANDFLLNATWHYNYNY